MTLVQKEPKKIYIGSTEVKKVYLGSTQVRPEEAPLTTAGIYWNASLGVISFQTSNGVGISIADKNLGATQVYNSGDNVTVDNVGYGFQRGNNYGWLYGTNPATSGSKVNASVYGPGNYYSSSTFICPPNPSTDSGYTWDSSDNANLWGGTTDTYIARRGPCDEGWHIPSTADCQTLVNAISSITGSVDGTKIVQYCKLQNNLPGLERGSGTWVFQGWTGLVKSDQYDRRRGGLLYINGSSYIINNNTPKANGYSIRAFSNTFIQPTEEWTKLN